MEPSKASEYRLHAVVLQRGGLWVAQCLEHDIATQARTEADLYAEVKRILLAHILRAQETGAEPFADIPKAPKRFWLLYKEASGPGRSVTVEADPSVAFQPVVELRAA